MLTQEQYETLLQELADLRESVKEEVRINEESKQVLDNFTDQSTSVVSTTEGLEELVQKLKHSLITGVTVSDKNLDERLLAL